MKIFNTKNKSNKEIIDTAIETLNNGGLIVFPTDTVYGLLADAQNPKAIDKLLQFKDRPIGKAISVFVADQKMAEKYIEINETAQNFFNNLLPGPFTLICNAKSEIISNLDPRLLAENGTLGIRIPDFPLILELVKQFGRPITATSANLSGTSPHYSIKSLRYAPTKKLSLLDLIVDFGNLPKNKPSTVIDTTAGKLTTLRFGDLFPASTNSLVSKSENDTKKLARFIVTKLSKNSSGKPLVFLLDGNLGAGKTIFTKGLGKALGVKDEIISPTYTISYEYRIIHKIVGAIHESPTDNPSWFSTNKSELSTPRPIVNDSGSDTKRLSHNTTLIQQRLKIDLPCHPELVEGSLSFENKERDSSTHCGSVGMTKNNIPKLIHYDLYRIESPEDLKEIGFLESFKKRNIYSVEWPERIDKITLEELKKIARVVYIKIHHLTPTSREISWNE